VFGCLGGYEDVNDAERLGSDTSVRWTDGGKAAKGQAASTSQMGHFEKELLATAANVEALADMNGAWIHKVHDRHPPTQISLDMDSSVNPTHGDQEGTADSGHFGCTCYPFFFCSASLGIWSGVFFAPEMFIASTAGVPFRNLTSSVTGNGTSVATFTGTPPSASPDVYRFLEEEGFLYATWLPKN